MNPDFKLCLEKKKIVPFTEGKSLVNKKLRTASEDLADGKFGLIHGKYKWSTIQGYYSMFHTARALLYSRGFREKSHHCLHVALIAFSVDEKKLGVEFVESFKNAMMLREDADYRTHFSKSGAKVILEKAEEFLNKTKELLETELKKT